MVSYIANFAYYALPTALILYGIRKYRESKWGRCTNNVSLQNKVAIVTGANCGIGYEIAKELCRRGATVVMACRNEEATLKAIEKIEREFNGKTNLVFMCLDLASLVSIKLFADEVNKKYDQIHILVNNAGVSYPDNSSVRTKDGFEIHFGVNYLGHFLLTNLLVSKLENGSPSRVVIVSSLLHEKGSFKDIKNVSAMKNLYANSKLMNMYFCKELSKNVAKRGITVYAVCPGWALTSLFRHSIRRMIKFFIFILPVAFLYMRSAKQGAQSVIYCATEPNIEHESGSFYRDCRKFESKYQFCDMISSNLWDETLTLIEEARLKH